MTHDDFATIHGSRKTHYREDIILFNRFVEQLDGQYTSQGSSKRSFGLGVGEQVVRLQEVK